MGWLYGITQDWLSEIRSLHRLNNTMGAPLSWYTYPWFYLCINEPECEIYTDFLFVGVGESSPTILETLQRLFTENIFARRRGFYNCRQYCRVFFMRHSSFYGQMLFQSSYTTCDKPSVSEYYYIITNLSNFQKASWVMATIYKHMLLCANSYFQYFTCR